MQDATQFAPHSLHRVVVSGEFRRLGARTLTFDKNGSADRAPSVPSVRRRSRRSPKRDRDDRPHHHRARLGAGSVGMASLSRGGGCGERRRQRSTHRARADRVRSRPRCRRAPNAWPRRLDAVAAGHGRAAPPRRDVCVVDHPAPARRGSRRRSPAHGRRLPCPTVGAEADRGAGGARGRGRRSGTRPSTLPERPGLPRVRADRSARALGDARRRRRPLRRRGSRSRSVAIRCSAFGGRVADNARHTANVQVHLACGWLASPRAAARAGARAGRCMVLYAKQSSSLRPTSDSWRDCGV